MQLWPKSVPTGPRRHLRQLSSACGVVVIGDERDQPLAALVLSDLYLGRVPKVRPWRIGCLDRIAGLVKKAHIGGVDTRRHAHQTWFDLHNRRLYNDRSVAVLPELSGASQVAKQTGFDWVRGHFGGID